MNSKLDKNRKIYFRDLFRDARMKALNNSENFEDLIFALEKLGSFITQTVDGLGNYKDSINNEAKKSVLAEHIPKHLPEFHTDFNSLYELVKDARNSAMHEGVFARHITQHAIEISLIIEDALMSLNGKVKDFMVRNPVCAYEWQPISFIRQNMLANSFSYLPIYHNGKWKLISDLQISKYLQSSTSKTQRKKKLSSSFTDSGIIPIDTEAVSALDNVKDILENWNGLPICVTLQNSDAEIVGILTPYDLL